MTLRTESLTKRFARVEALTGLTLEVPEGSVFALVGPNGAGKTTAIKVLMSILRPTSGRAEVLGVDSRKLGPGQLAQIGYMSENQQLPGWMRVGYFLSYCKRFYAAWQDDDLAALVRQYALPLDRKIRTLSRGMRVKAALAASLAYRPRLIVLDEPAAHRERPGKGARIDGLPCVARPGGDRELREPRRVSRSGPAPVLRRNGRALGAVP